jgi:hypothetical protein
MADHFSQNVSATPGQVLTSNGQARHLNSNLSDSSQNGAFWPTGYLANGIAQVGF